MMHDMENNNTTLRKNTFTQRAIRSGSAASEELLNCYLGNMRSKRNSIVLPEEHSREELQEQPLSFAFTSI